MRLSLAEVAKPAGTRSRPAGHLVRPRPATNFAVAPNSGPTSQEHAPDFISRHHVPLRESAPLHGTCVVAIVS
jgi:hypothetical protein